IWLQLIETIAVSVGVVFAIVQVRQIQRERARDSALELLHSFQTPEFAKAGVLTYALPDGLTKAEIESRLGDEFHLDIAMTPTWESIGILVFRREVHLDVVSDFFSGPIILSWQKLGNHFRAERKASGRETIGEWFEWLRDRLVEWESAAPPIPAHIEHKDWKPPTKRK